MTTVSLRPDCGRCAALCCVALDFDKSPHFAIDKPAGVPCPNLTSGARCTIHADLAARGFGGCVRYDCLGAGQRVVQEVFAGRSWQSEPELLAPMMDAFASLRKAHTHLQLLASAEALSLTRDQENQRLELEQEMTEAGHSARLVHELAGRITAWLRTLSPPDRA